MFKRLLLCNVFCAGDLGVPVNDIISGTFFVSQIKWEVKG